MVYGSLEPLPIRFWIFGKILSMGVWTPPMVKSVRKTFFDQGGGPNSHRPFRAEHRREEEGGGGIKYNTILPFTFRNVDYYPFVFWNGYKFGRNRNSMYKSLYIMGENHTLLYEMGAMWGEIGTLCTKYRYINW